jgi:centractin
MRRLGPKDAKIRILAPQERIYSTWIGGSILASLDTFRKIWVTRHQFNDIGKGIIARKTF